MRTQRQPAFIFRYSTAVHFLCYACAIFVMTPFNSKVMPAVTWCATLIAVIMIVYWRVRPLTLLQKSRMEWGEYKKMAGSTLMSSLLFLASCLAFKYHTNFGIALPVMLSLITAGVICYTIVLYFDAIDEGKKILAKKAFTIIKGMWLIISFISYILARKVFMDMADVTYDTTFNKITSFGFFLIFCTLYFSMIFLLFIIILPSLRNSLFQFNFLAICTPISCAVYIFFIAYNVNTNRVIEYIFNVTIKIDTRETFFCNNGYHILDNYPNARFMMISEGNYRVFTSKKHDYGIWRLTCKDTAPFYTLVEVLNRKDIEDNKLKAAEK